MRSSVFLVSLVAVRLLFATSADAQLLCAPATLQSTNTPGDFGAAVSVFRDTAAVGSLAGSGFYGPVFIYGLEDGLWLEQQQLLPLDLVYQFGKSISLHNDLLAVAFSGGVILYRNDGASWQPEQTVDGNDPDGSGAFARIAVVEGATLVINDPFDSQAAESAGAVHIYRLDGSSWVHDQKILPPTAIPNDHFGDLIALAGNELVACSSGRVFVFHFDGTSWVFQQELSIPAGVGFVEAVAINGHTIMIGDSSDSNNRGTVYVFDFDGFAWHLSQQLFAADPDPDGYFGRTIAISGQRAVIGSNGHDHVYGFRGAVYVFGFDGFQWVQVQEFLPSRPIGPGEDFIFPRALGLSDDLTLVGEKGMAEVFCLGPGVCCDHASGICSADTLNSTCVGPNQDWYDLTDCSTVSCDPIIGACCAALSALESTCQQTNMAECPAGFFTYFTADTSCQQVSCDQPCMVQEISGMTLQTGSGYGQAVAVDGEFAVIGQYVDQNFDGTAPATVFQFANASWTRTVELQPFPYQSRDQFGSSVAISGTTLVIGAPSDAPGWNPPPAVYVFRYDGVSWNQEAKLVPGDGTDPFGHFVDISNDRIVVSAKDSGFVFHFDGSNWLLEQKIPNVGHISPVAIDHDVLLLGGNVYRRTSTSWVQEFFELDDGSTSSTVDIGPTSIFKKHPISIFNDVALFGFSASGDFGHASIFRFNGSAWQHEQDFFPATRQVNDGFGYCVDVFGDRAVVGAITADGSAPRTGAVFVFGFNGINWIQESSLLRPELENLQGFGWNVAFDGFTAIVGDPNGHGQISGTGTAYAFRLSGLGACCNRRYGSCSSCESQSQCDGSDEIWAEGAGCLETHCEPAIGSCCDLAVLGNPTISHCTQTSFADCNCPACQWTIDADCSAIVCEPTYGAIPTVTEWGMAVLTLSLLIVSKVAFSKRTT